MENGNQSIPRFDERSELHRRWRMGNVWVSNDGGLNWEQWPGPYVSVPTVGKGMRVVKIDPGEGTITLEADDAT